MATNWVIVVANIDVVPTANGSAQTTTSNSADALAFSAPLEDIAHPGTIAACWTSWFMEDADKATFLTQLGGALGPPDPGTYRVYDGNVTDPEAVLAAEGLQRVG